MSARRLEPLALVVSGPDRPQLAAAGYTVARASFCACASWVSVRSTIGLIVCRERRHVAVCNGSRWIVYPPRLDWSPPAWESPSEPTTCDVLEWADHSRADDPWAPAHEAARSALVLLGRRSWAVWWELKGGDAAAAAATAVSRLDAALRDHHGRAVAKGDKIVVTVDGEEVATVGGTPDAQEVRRIRELLHQRGAGSEHGRKA
jgi:hypothetical protein